MFIQLLGFAVNHSSDQLYPKKADYCLALKANQDLTYEQVRGFFELGTHDYKTAQKGYSQSACLPQRGRAERTECKSDQLCTIYERRTEADR